MLISFESIQTLLKENNITINGVLHIGAHECEELSLYNQLGISSNDIIWIDALLPKVTQATLNNIPNVYHGVITDKDDDLVNFNVSNNGQSSSVLEFGTHAQEHPWVVYVDTIVQKTITVDTFFKNNHLEASQYTFWNLDIQGAELMALHGATQSIQYATVIYIEVNEKELYKKCGLMHEIDTFLSNYSFKRVMTSMTEHGWGDAIYIKN